MMPTSPTRRGILLGLAAAVSFGISAPLAKRLLDDVGPQMLAGLLYLGAFAALNFVPSRSGTEVPERVSGVAGSLLLNLEGPLTILVGIALFREHLSRPAAIGAVVVFAAAIVLGLETGDAQADWIGQRRARARDRRWVPAPRTSATCTTAIVTDVAPSADLREQYPDKAKSPIIPRRAGRRLIEPERRTPRPTRRGRRQGSILVGIPGRMGR